MTNEAQLGPTEPDGGQRKVASGGGGGGRHDEADGDEIDSGGSEEQWDAHIDNWEELYAEVGNELPRMQIDRRRFVAAEKLRMLIQKLDYDFNRAILQLDEQDMERLIAADVDDAATGYLATARRLGKGQPREPNDADVNHTTERVKYMERSKEMVGIFNEIVRSHDHQLYRAVHTLTQEQRERIVRANHEQFSGFHRQKKRTEADRSGDNAGGQPSDGQKRDFVTPRVKSAAKSRRAVALLNNIVDAKDKLLKEVIVSMDRSARNHLISKNNDFVKFEEQRKIQREEFAMTKKTATAAEHKFATQHVKQVVRAKAACEVFEAILRAKGKQLAAMVKKIPKPDKDGFLKQVSGGRNNLLQKCQTHSVVVSKRQNSGRKTMDTARYIRGEVMVLRRQVKEDVKNAIEAKDRELANFVASMDEEQMGRTLNDCVPSGADDLSIWRRDRQKQSWRHLSAFGLIRDNPSFYRQWKQQRCQRRNLENEKREDMKHNNGVLGIISCANAVRRQPWTTDLHYVRRYPSSQRQQQWKSTGIGDQTTAEPQQRRFKNRPHAEESNKGFHSGDVGAGDGITGPEAVFQSRFRQTVIARARPASAPPVQRGAVGRVTPGTRLSPDPPSLTSRSPSLARLARVFYQSSVASTASIRGVQQVSDASLSTPDRNQSRLEGTMPTDDRQNPQEKSCRADTPAMSDSDAGQRYGRSEGDDELEESHGSGIRNWSCHSKIRTEIITNSGSENARMSGRERRRQPDHTAETIGVEGRLEEMCLMWTASQLSAEAVTKKIMSGYFERERAREPNGLRQPGKTGALRAPQPPPENRKRGSCKSVQGRGRQPRRRNVTESTGPPMVEVVYP